MLTNNYANRYFSLLLQKIVWENDEVVIFGKHIIAKRKVAWYGDSIYSNTTKQALVWSKETFRTYRDKILINPHNGNEGIGWHSDNEESIEPNSTISSLSKGLDN